MITLKVFVITVILFGFIHVMSLEGRQLLFVYILIKFLHVAWPTLIYYLLNAKHLPVSFSLTNCLHNIV